MNTADLNLVALKGFGAAAAAYVRGRPSYPAELLTWLRETLELGPATTVLELGAGTGKFTQLLLETEARVVAVEPIDAMRSELAAKFHDLKILAASAESIPISDGSVDAVVCAQAFHWFANEVALSEMHRVLKPRGKLGLIWNVRDESIDWVARITAIITPYEGAAPRYHKGEWRRAFSTSLFSPLIETRFPFAHSGPPADVIVDRFMSVSFIAALPDEDNRRVRQQLTELIETHPELKSRSTIAVPYTSHAYASSRL
jgi:SAM-dependent methyltransferase